MKRTILIIAVIGTLAATAPPSHALSLLLSSPDDLGNLVIGQSVRVDVSLSGLTGEELVSLTSSVLYPAGVFGAPTAMSAGPIVPNPPASPLDFQTLGAAGLADAIFLTFDAASDKHITSDGAFYFFDVTAGAVGSGQFELDPLALTAEQFDPLDPGSPILRAVDAGPPLPFTVIPEPVSLLLVPMGLCAAGGYLSRRRAGR